MAKLLVFLFLGAFAVAVFSAPTEDENSTSPEDHSQQESEKMDQSHRSKCEVLFSRTPSDPVSDDVYSCSHECLIYKKYFGGYRENGVCRCC